MPAPGQKLGPYELVSPIGEGGMGEVWKARDPRLGRTVAIKLAKGSFGERFEREARAVAALNHPHICTLYDVGPEYLVMEYIDGKPLQGPLPVDVAVRYGVEIAQALDAAHRIGIVHRDLKPGNVLITKQGIKLLDFGLAKVVAPAPSPEETVTRALTEEGTILGTLQYMSPEQLEGKEADERSDIFAFGCVLYEALTGAPAFAADSRAGVIAAILERQPKPLANVPSRLESAIRRCLAKDPDERWQSARDVAGVLELAVGDADPAPPPARSSKGWLVAMAGVAVLAIGAAVWFARHQAPEELWTGEPLGGPAQASEPRVSPDGSTLAFQAIVEGQNQIAIMTPASGDWKILTHQNNSGYIVSMDWSRDGSRIYFDRYADTPRGIFSVPVLGGEPRLVLESAVEPLVLADGSLVVTRINQERQPQLFHYFPDAGKLEPLPFSPLYSIYRVSQQATRDGKAIVIYGSPLDPQGTPGHPGIYHFGIASRKVVNVAPGQSFRSGAVPVTTTPDGRFVMYATSENGFFRIMSVPSDGSGEMRQVLTLTHRLSSLDVAPDGTIYGDQTAIGNMLLRFSAAGGVPERLTPTPGHYGDLVLVLPDGRPLVHTLAGLKRLLQIRNRDGSASALIEGSQDFFPPAAMVGDGKVAVLTDRRPLEIAIVSIADGRIVARVPVKAGSISSLASSTDGRTLFFSSDGAIWSMPAAGGEPVKLGAGDKVSADPNGRDLLVSRGEADAIRLFRLPASGGAEEPIAFRGDEHLAETQLSASAIGPGGLIVVQTASADKWMFAASLIDPRKGTISRIPLDFEGEIGSPQWTKDGKIVALGSTYDMTIWRFHRKK